MKKIINDPADVVAEALTGMALAHADLLEVHRDPDFITRRGGAVSGKVALLSAAAVATSRCTAVSWVTGC